MTPITHSKTVPFTPILSIPFDSLSSIPNPFHSIPFHSIPFHSIPFHSIPFHSIPFHSIPFHSIPFHSFHSIQPNRSRTAKRRGGSIGLVLGSGMRYDASQRSTNQTAVCAT